MNAAVRRWRREGGQGGRRGEVSSPDPSSDGGGERGRIRHCARAQEMMKFKIPALWLRLNLGAQPRARANPSPSNYWPWIDCILSLKTAVSNTTFFFFFLPSICSTARANRIIKRWREKREKVTEWESWPPANGSVVISLNCTLPSPFTLLHVGAYIIKKKVDKLTVKRLYGCIGRH